MTDPIPLRGQTRFVTRRVVGDRRSLAKRLHLRERQGEWWSALMFLACAAILAMPGDALAGPTWAAFHRFGLTEVFWTWAFSVIGSARMVALIVNGSMQLVTPVVRCAGAMLGAWSWSQLGVLLFIGGMDRLGTPTLGVGLFAVLTLVECCNVLMAAVDVRTQPS